MREVKLQVGASFTLSKGLLGVRSTRIIYGGMVNTDTFSIVVVTAEGYRSAAYNLYLHKDRKHLELAGHTLRIMCVSHTEFWFQLDE